MPGIAHLISFQLAALSPSQWPEYFPTPGKEERVRMNERLLPKTCLTALEDENNRKIQSVRITWVLESKQGGYCAGETLLMSHFNYIFSHHIISIIIITDTKPVKQLPWFKIIPSGKRDQRLRGQNMNCKCFFFIIIISKNVSCEKKILSMVVCIRQNTTGLASLKLH